MVLRDKEIREALINYLNGRHPAPVKIIEELGVHNGNAIADIVAVYDKMHCFEIKGQTDNVKRISKQSAFYSEAFPKLTLVTTSNHIEWAIKNLPDYWGILLANFKNESVQFIYKRRAKNNPKFVKNKAFLMLWKDELLRIALDINDFKLKSSYSREDIAAKVSKIVSKDGALSSIKNAILERSLNSVSNKSDMG